MAKQATKKEGKLLSNINNTGYFFIIPFIIVFLIFGIYPVFRTFSMSFTNFKGFGEAQSVGADNYIRVFSDKLFWRALLNTFKMWGMNIVIQLGLAFLLTMLFNDMKYRMKGLSLFRALFYLPNLIATTSVAFLFSTLLDWKYGSFNQVLLSLRIINAPIDWMKIGPLSQNWVSIIGAWMWFGNSFILLMAGVQGIPKDYFEAATIDGAGRWTILGKITMPLLRPIMLYVAITSLIGGLQLFEVPFLLTDKLGGPNGYLSTAVMYLYNMAFKYNQMGYAAALAYVLFIIILVFSAASFLLINRKEAK